MARPSIYNDATADLICELLMSGESLRAICRMDGMPSLDTIYKWIARNPVFAERYARAKADGLEKLAEEILEIADEPLVCDGPGMNAEVQKQRLRVDTRKWLLSKLKAKKYGDRITQEHTSPDGSSPVVNVVIRSVLDKP